MEIAGFLLYSLQKVIQTEIDPEKQDAIAASAITESRSAHGRIRDQTNRIDKIGQALYPGKNRECDTQYEDAAIEIAWHFRVE